MKLDLEKLENNQLIISNKIEGIHSLTVLGRNAMNSWVLTTECKEGCIEDLLNIIGGLSLDLMELTDIDSYKRKQR